jgi:hypothetical protein
LTSSNVGAQIREHWQNAGVSASSLSRVWQLVDAERSGRLNEAQFALLSHVVATLIGGAAVPTRLGNALLASCGIDTSAPRPRAATATAAADVRNATLLCEPLAGVAQPLKALAYLRSRLLTRDSRLSPRFSLILQWLFDEYRA